MRTGTDAKLVADAVNRYLKRLTPAALSTMNNPTTVLATDKYARGHWTFYCPATLEYVRVRQMPTGDDADVRIFTVYVEDGWQSGIIPKEQA